MHQLTSAMGFAGKYMLAACRVSLTARLGFCSTHVMCNKQARIILARDGFAGAARVLESFSKELDLGVCWPDSGWGSLHHFYHAKTGAGLLTMKAANVFFERYYLTALHLWRKGSFEKAMFFLGAVTHLLQDICEPHHTNCSWGLWHSNYEKWVRDNKYAYLVQQGGIYLRQQHDPVNWLKKCAQSSYQLIDLVGEKSCESFYKQATGHLLPMTQQITAGFWLDFLSHAGVIQPSRMVLTAFTTPGNLAPTGGERPAQKLIS